MAEQITQGDVEAFADVLTTITEQSDEYTLEAALQLKAELEAVGKTIRETTSLLETQIRRLMDGSTKQVVGTKTVTLKPNAPKWEPNHGKIRKLVVSRSIIDDEGERVALPQEAAEQAVELMYQMFVAPSDMPKAGALKALRIFQEDVADKKDTGDKLVVTDAE
jgi:hypothetical protein